MTEPRFRHDNTEGYSDEELAELNRRWRIACDELGPERRDDERYKEEVANRIRVRFDAQRSPLRPAPGHYTKHDAPE